MGKLKKNSKVDFLKRFKNLKLKNKFSTVKSCNNYDIHTLCECVYNILHNGLKLNSFHKTKIKKSLKPIKLQVRKLADAKVSIKTKRKLLSNPQVGKGIFSILGTLASIIIPAIISANSKK